MVKRGINTGGEQGVKREWIRVRKSQLEGGCIGGIGGKWEMEIFLTGPTVTDVQDSYIRKIMNYNTVVSESSRKLASVRQPPSGWNNLENLELQTQTTSPGTKPSKCLHLSLLKEICLGRWSLLHRQHTQHIPLMHPEYQLYDR